MGSSLLLWLFLPLAAIAGTRADIPTSIQVVDQMGRTRISTSSSAQVVEPMSAPLEIPSSCSRAMDISAARANTSFAVPESHPMRTRSESQLGALRSIASEITFAPHVSSVIEESLRNALLSTPGATSSPILSCLGELNAKVVERGGPDSATALSRLKEVFEGIDYVSASLSTGALVTPQTQQEALYASDLLRAEHPKVRSLFFNDSSLVIEIEEPVQIFGRWATIARLRITSDESSARITSPWWMFLAPQGISDIERRLDDVAVRTNTVEGMFLRTKDILAIAGA